jgi:hypothetical protein
MVGRHFGYKQKFFKRNHWSGQSIGAGLKHWGGFFFNFLIIKLLNYLFDNSGDNPQKVNQGSLLSSLGMRRRVSVGN